MKKSEDSTRDAAATAKVTRAKRGASAKKPASPGGAHVPGSGRPLSSDIAADVSTLDSVLSAPNDARMHSSRFVTVLPAIPEEDLGLLPSMYDVDRVFAVPRDPERVFATWDLSVATRRRVQPGGLFIRFTFDDGVRTDVVSEAVIPGSFQYYGIVPDGMLAVTVDLVLGTGPQAEMIASSGRIGLAIAFVRQGEPLFARVDRDTPLSCGGDAVVPVQSPAVLPGADIQEGRDLESRVRGGIGYMPVSGRK